MIVKWRFDYINETLSFATAWSTASEMRRPRAGSAPGSDSRRHGMVPHTAVLGSCITLKMAV